MFKIVEGIIPTLVREMFPLNQENRTELRNCTEFVIGIVGSVGNTLECVSYLGP